MHIDLALSRSFMQTKDLPLQDAKNYLLPVNGYTHHRFLFVVGYFSPHTDALL